MGEGEETQLKKVWRIVVLIVAIPVKSCIFIITKRREKMTNAPKTNPVSFATVRKFRDVVLSMKRYGKNSCGHKMAQAKAVAVYLAEREVRG